MHVAKMGNSTSRRGAHGLEVREVRFCSLLTYFSATLWYPVDAAFLSPFNIISCRVFGVNDQLQKTEDFFPIIASAIALLADIDPNLK